MNIKNKLNSLKKKIGLTSTLLLATTLSPNSVQAQEITDNKDKTEITTVSDNYLVLDTAAIEGVLIAENEKEANKLLRHYSKQYDIKKEDIPLLFEKVLKNFSGQEYLYLETVKNDMKPHKHTVYPFTEIGDIKTKYTHIRPGPKKSHFDSFHIAVIGYVSANNSLKRQDFPERNIDIDYLHTIVNAKDVFEKSGLNLLNPIPEEKKLFSNEGLLNMAENRIYGDNYGVDMQVNHKTGRLNGISTILKFNDGQAEEIAHLKYDNGKFIGGDVNGNPIRKVDNSNQIAIQKALSNLIQNQ